LELELEAIAVLQDALSFYREHGSAGNTGIVGALLTLMREERQRIEQAQSLNHNVVAPGHVVTTPGTLLGAPTSVIPPATPPVTQAEVAPPPSLPQILTEEVDNGNG
jgi:hypothetical protein